MATCSVDNNSFCVRVMAQFALALTSTNPHCWSDALTTLPCVQVTWSKWMIQVKDTSSISCWACLRVRNPFGLKVIGGSFFWCSRKLWSRRINFVCSYKESCYQIYWLDCSHSEISLEEPQLIPNQEIDAEACIHHPNSANLRHPGKSRTESW